MTVKKSHETTPDSWWQKDGIRFECQGSGKCCTSHGEFGFVFMTPADRRLMAKHLGLSTAAFTRQYCERYEGYWHLKERKDNPDCLFLKGKQCGIYEARPVQCRTWPFWPEVLAAKAWKKDVVSFCPGVGKGRKWTPAEIALEVAAQTKSERALTKERRGR